MMKKKALVLGLGISGKSAARFLLGQGYSVVGVDDHVFPQIESVEIKRKEEITSLEEFALFVPSPGIAKTHPLYRLALKTDIEICGEIELALRTFQGRCIGVTGTNGKTTVVKMLEYCLNALGKKAKALGNVGTALGEYLCSLPSKDEILVIELSSYQLETLQAKVMDVGLLLNIAEDHLDRYSSIFEYAEAKCNLQYCMKEKGIFYVQQEVVSAFSSLLKEPFIPFSKEGCAFTEIALQDRENVCAVFLALSYFGVSKKEFEGVLKGFKRPQHRLEFVEEIKGAAYYDDSKATNIAAVIHALRSVEGKIVLLLGGQDKSLSFEPLKEFKEKISRVIAFGQSRKKIIESVEKWTIVDEVATVKESVERAALVSKEGESVLFSPGCTSLDAFNNYAERGEEFKRCVTSLKRGKNEP